MPARRCAKPWSPPCSVPRAAWSARSRPRARVTVVKARRSSSCEAPSEWSEAYARVAFGNVDGDRRTDDTPGRIREAAPRRCARACRDPHGRRHASRARGGRPARGAAHDRRRHGEADREAAPRSVALHEHRHLCRRRAHRRAYVRCHRRRSAEPRLDREDDLDRDGARAHGPELQVRDAAARTAARSRGHDPRLRLPARHLGSDARRRRPRRARRTARGARREGARWRHRRRRRSDARWLVPRGRSDRHQGRRARRGTDRERPRRLRSRHVQDRREDRAGGPAPAPDLQRRDDAGRRGSPARRARDPRHARQGWRDALSARELVAVLRCAAGSPVDSVATAGNAGLGSLSIGGTDGTLGRRFKTPGLKGHIHAKTGTLSNVIALTGVLDLDPQRPLAFSIVTNGDRPLQKGYVRKTHEQLVGLLVKYLSKTAKTPVPVIAPQLPSLTPPPAAKPAVNEDLDEEPEAPLDESTPKL